MSALRFAVVLAVTGAACASFGTDDSSDTLPPAGDAGPNDAADARANGDASAANDASPAFDCDASFCDGFERDDLKGSWTLDDSRNEASLGDHAFTGEHGAHFSVVPNAGGAPADLNRVMPSGGLVDLDFEFYPAMDIGGAGEHVNIAQLDMPASVPFNAEVILESGPSLALTVLSTDGFYQVMGPIPVSVDWHLIHVTLDLGARQIMLAVDGTAVTQSIQDHGFMPASGGTLTIGPNFTTKGVTPFAVDYDDVRLDVR